MMPIRIVEYSAFRLWCKRKELNKSLRHKVVEFRSLYLFHTWQHVCFAFFRFVYAHKKISSVGIRVCSELLDQSLETL